MPTCPGPTNILGRGLRRPDSGSPPIAKRSPCCVSWARQRTFSPPEEHPLRVERLSQSAGRALSVARAKAAKKSSLYGQPVGQLRDYGAGRRKEIGATRGVQAMPIVWSLYRLWPVVLAVILLAIAIQLVS